MSVPSAGSVLDDVAALERGDLSAMLRLVAGSGAQVREAAGAAAEAGLERLAQDGRPRAVVVAGVGASGLAGDLLAAVAGLSCPVPVVVHRGYGLPRWVGAADVVCGVSAAGNTDETLSAVEQAVTRGCSVVGVGPEYSPLAELIARGRGVHVPVPAGRPARASLWALSVPLLLAADALDLLTVGPADLAAAADRLDSVAEQCRPTSESFINPAKQLALELSGRLPMVWGASPLAGVAAYRLQSQLAENAKYPCLAGVLPEVGHNQLATLDGVFGGKAPGRDRDIFADRADEPDVVRLRLVLVRDTDEHPRPRHWAESCAALVVARGIEVTELVAEGDGPVERFASLVGVPDFASVYLAVRNGIDPTSAGSVTDLLGGSTA